MQKINQNKPEDTQFLQYCNVFNFFLNLANQSAGPKTNTTAKREVLIGDSTFLCVTS